MNRAATLVRHGTSLGLLAALVMQAGCSANSARLPLQPGGEALGTATLLGRLDFGTPGVYPQTLVLLARVRDPNFRSTNTSIRVAGSNTTPEWTIGVSPRLTQVSFGVWVDTLRLEAGSFEWKFVTNDVWESPSDYASSDASRPDGLSNTLGISTGAGSNLRATVPADYASGVVGCSLDETVTPARYRFFRLGDGPATFSGTIDGTFTMTGLTPGNYIMELRPSGQAVSRTTITVSPDGTDLGVVSIQSSSLGTVRGTVAWDATFPDLATPPYPPSVAYLFEGATLIDSALTTRASSAFQFDQLPPGTYRVVADAHLFAATTRDTIALNGGTRDIGAVTLPFDLNELPSQMNLVGDFNGFPGTPFPDSTAMDQIQLGVWVYPNSSYPAQTIPAGTYNMKFVTDGSYDNPTDFGGDESFTITAPVTHAETRLVGGLGTALHVVFNAPGQYRFTLDERRQTFTIEPMTSPARIRARAGASWRRR